MIDYVFFFIDIVLYECRAGLDLLETIHFYIIILYHIYFYLPSDVISQEKTATSSRSITKASKYAIPLKPTHKLAESKRYLVTW